MKDDVPAEQILTPDDSRTVLQVGGRYYILATSATGDENDRVLKEGETFAIFDRHGDIKPVGLGSEGLFHLGTRFLSGMTLRIGDEMPLLLGSTSRRDNSRVAVDLANPDMKLDGRMLRSGTVHLARTKVLWDGTCHERIEIRNFGEERVSLPISLRFAADYADIFEVRGTERSKRGQLHEPRVDSGAIVLRYDGLDGRQRTTRITPSPAPDRLDTREAFYAIDLAPGHATTIELRIACEMDGPAPALDFGTALERTTDELGERFDVSANFASSSDMFDDWVSRSLADVVMMTSDTPDGPYPYAGVPWFSTVFGRDGLITAFQLLWVQPSLARGVLAHLAATQATEDDPARDAQPGKILHEVRHGEMAALGEVPFARYYGSHDATPLFVMLAHAYYRQTGDLELIRGIWPQIDRALGWIEGPADLDGDGLIEYAKRTPIGLTHQGWKDSVDSVFHADGSLAQGPIALCELQAYAYAARVGAAEIADLLGEPQRAAELRERAEHVRAEFEARFWIDELGTYGIALDGEKRLCRVRTSNPGHCLFSGIVGEERAGRVADDLLSDAMYSGWGIRTVAAGAPRYNPMSYHDGSVWPHDNGIAALGMARYGYRDHAARVLSGIFEASRHFDLARLPELFCGFSRRPGEGPTHYPVACSPQSWAAGSVFMLLQASLGLQVDGPGRVLRLNRGRLPLFLDRLRIANLPVGDARLDLVLERQPQGIGVNVLSRTGEVDVVTVK